MLERHRTGTYFDDWDRSIANNPVKCKHFRHIEAELAGLDAAAWEHLKAHVVPLFESYDDIRGWQAAFDKLKLNEAKGYNFLTRLGCTDVTFVPAVPASRQKTPDLRGKLGTGKVLCEVKTINPSDFEASRRCATLRGENVVFTIQAALPGGFFRKLIATIEHADAQMAAYCSHDAGRRIAYVILNFDDGLSEYSNEYIKQIQEFLHQAELPRSEIVFDLKPGYYSATSESIASRRFLYSLDRSWAPLPGDP
ncbi:MAG TPA: hypothetical protein VFL55_15500 [Acetobacteraceae bacterium]|nr:hypothetical protein [Acetobacteraceae bacterium]